MRDYKGLKDKLFAEIYKHPTMFRNYDDLFAVLRELAEEDPDEAHQASARLRRQIARVMPGIGDVGSWFDLYKRTLLFDAKESFDCYLLYLEIDRKPSERYYQPRRSVLKVAVDAMQDLADNKLDELFISMPPRTGKTTLLMMFVTWILGRWPEKSNLYSAYSDLITKAFYEGIIEVIEDRTTYKWHDVFKTALASQNAQNETLDIDRRKRYHSLTCRSLYGTLNGACDCGGFLISDDLIGGIEEALNKDRLTAAWSKVDNNLLPRAKESAKILWCGTRWSISDPAGLRMSLLEEDPTFKNRRYKVINLAALDENDESNFDYSYGVGFSTEFYRQRRASFEHNNDLASWMAQYMGEPIEREGTLFTPDDFSYYNGVLPDGEPDRKFAAVDPAWGGGDFVSAPIAYQYGSYIYIVDVVFSNDDKSVTQPLVASKAIKHGLNAMQIECTKATVSYKEGVEKLLRDQHFRMNLTSKSAPPTTSKEQRIYDRAPDVRDLCIFLEPSKRSKEYQAFMMNVFGYKKTGKNKNDDAPDSLAMLMDMVLRPSGSFEIFARPC